MASSWSTLRASTSTFQLPRSEIRNKRSRTASTEFSSIPEPPARSLSRQEPELRSVFQDIMKSNQQDSQVALIRRDHQMTTAQAPCQDYKQTQAPSRKAQYYHAAFASRHQPDSTTERTSILTAELKTNVIIKDEYTFLTTFSAFLSSRYNRSEASILITISHSACMLFGGTFAPAYLLNISAVPEQVKPTTNRRNTALIQRLLTEELNVAAERGIVKFCATEEENIGIGGETLSTINSGATTDESRPIVDNSSSFSKRFTKKTRPGNVTAARQALAAAMARPNLPTPPASPPSLPTAIVTQTTNGRPISSLQLTAGGKHSRSASEATTSSDPEIDVMRNPIRETVDMSNFEYGSKKRATSKSPKELKGKKSGFFRRLVAA